MTPHLKKLAVAASVAVLALGTAACGGSDSSSDSDTTKGSSSTSETSGDDLTEANFVETITAAQLEAKTSHVVMDIGVGGQSIKAEGDVAVGDTPADTAMTLSMNMGSAGMDNLKMVLVDEAFYLNFGSMTDNKYAKVDLTDTSDPITKQFGSLTEQLDPSQQLEQFKTALTSFKKKGTPEKLDGVEAQPYEIVLDTSKIKGMADLPSSAGASLPKTLSYTMYIGSDNLLRRLTSDVAGIKVQIDYSRWGDDVDVQAPAAGEITEKGLSQLSGGAS